MGRPGGSGDDDGGDCGGVSSDSVGGDGGSGDSGGSDDVPSDAQAGREAERLAERVSFAPAPDPVRPAIVAELDAVAVNGGCALLAIDVEDDGALDALDRPAAFEAVSSEGFLHAVLTSEAANEACPALDTRGGFGGADGSPAFEWSHALTTAGHVAWLLVRGGAYGEFDGSHAEAKALGEGFVDDLFGDRYEDVAVRRTTDRWSDWFATVPHWDETLVCCDVAETRVWVLLFTDTD